MSDPENTIDYINRVLKYSNDRSVENKASIEGKDFDVLEFFKSIENGQE